MTSRSAPGGQLRTGSLHGATSLRAEPYPFPPNSIQPDPLDLERLRERVSLAFVSVLVSLVVVTPLIAAWAMIQFK